MAGKHIYSSSEFIQSGAVAQFKSGISASGLTIEGSVFASNYFDLNGDEITGGGGSTAVFFAGSGSGVSESTPFSQDTFIELNSAVATVDSNFADVGIIRIETTSSGDFNPNYFNFLKIGTDVNDNITTVKQGEDNFYEPTSEDERKGGINKYIIYAAETGSGGETHQVFHTVTVGTFVNVPPTLLPIDGTLFNLFLDHDSSSKSIKISFEESFDENQLNEENDFLQFFTASRNNLNDAGTSQTSTQDTYTLTLQHSDSDVNTDDQDGLPSIAISELTAPGLSSSAGAPRLHFTASVSNYDATDGNTNTIKDSLPQTEVFKVTLKDQYFDLVDLTLQGITTHDNILLVVHPPATASIDNIIVKFEGDDNTQGFTNKLVDTHNHTVLYDFTETLTSESIRQLDDRYTSSIVRIQVQADTIHPVTVNNNHHTYVQIQSGSSTTLNNDNNKLGFFRIDGNSSVATNVNESSINPTGTFNSLENETNTSNRFTIVKQLPIDSNGNAQSISTEYYGTNTTLANLNNITRVKHGTLKNNVTNDHYEVISAITPAANLTINKCPNIKIENVVVEVESGNDHQQGYFSDNGTNQLTSSLLYGLTSSITSDEIPTLFGTLTAGQEPYNTYVSQSIVRLRLKCNIIEPFGPSHKDIVAQIKADDGGGLGETTVETKTLTIDPTNTGGASSLLGGEGGILVNEDLDLTSLFTADGVTDISAISGIRITNISLRGDLGTHINSNGDLECFNSFQIGGVYFSDNNLTTEGIFGQQFTPNQPSNEGNSAKDPGGDPVDFTTAWVGSQVVALNNDGSININLDPDEGIDYSSWGNDSLVGNPLNNEYEIQITFDYDVTTGVAGTSNPYINAFETEAQFTLNTSSEYVTDFGHTTNHGYGGSTFTGKELLTGSYTSSWVEFKTLPGTSTFSAHFTSSSINVGTDTVDLSNNASVTMSAALPTKIEDITYEVEKFGYSETDATTDSVRTVLYGNAHFTNDGTGSGDTGVEWGRDTDGILTHPLGDVYASHSVSRFRFKAKITEPVGIASSTPNIAFLLKPTDGDSNYSNTTFGNTNISTTLGEITNTGNISSSVSELVNNQKITVITSSWIGRQITLQGGDQNANGSQNFTISGTLGYTFDPTFEAGAANSFEIIDTPEENTITVNQTPSTVIDSVIIETETFGYSSASFTNSSNRTVLYGDNKQTNDGTGSSDSGFSWGRIPSNNVSNALSDVYASHSVSRFRFKTEITEPLGPGHFPTTINKVDSQGSTVIQTDTISTESGQNGFLTDSNYLSAPDYRKRSVYTSSWDGIQLSTTLGTNTLHTISPTVNHSPTDEIATTSITNQGSTNLNVIDTAPAEIKDVKVETETNGYSEVVDNNSTIIRTVLYGDAHLTNDGTGSGESGASWANHHSASVFASQSVSRFRVKFKVIEPIGPLHHDTTFTKQFTHQDGTLNTPSAEIFNTSSALVTDENHFDVGGIDTNSDRLIYTVTSSWIGQQLSSTDHSSGQTTTYAVPSANISHTAPNESTNTYTAIDNSINITVFDTPPTQITNLEFETETEGLSGVGINSTTRTVLYGDSHITNASTNATWASHINATTYNELSITRFRVKAKVIEPVGPLHHTTTFDKTLTSTNYSFSPSTININSGSSGHTITTDVSDDNQLIIFYTTSFVGTQLESENQSGEVYTYTGTTTHNPTNENNHNASEPIISTITVNDTPDTIISIISVDVETFGESNLAAPNNTSNTSIPTTHTRTPLIGSSSTSPTGSGIPIDQFTGSAVLRTRIQSIITEPIGPLHHGASMSVSYDASSGVGSDQIGPKINFSTSSTDHTTVPPNSYNSDKKLVTTYTSLFTGSAIPPQTYYELKVFDSDILFTPSGENSFTTDNSGKSLNFIKVNDSSDPTITNFFIEVENDESGSNVGNRESRVTNVLHGNTGSETDHNKNLTYPNDGESREQLVSFRVLATLIQPPSLDHHAVNLSVKKFFSSSNKTFIPTTTTPKTLTFNTASDNPDVANFNATFDSTGTIIHYSSSFFPILLEASGNKSFEDLIPAGTEFSSKIHSEPVTRGPFNFVEAGGEGFFVGGSTPFLLKLIPHPPQTELTASSIGGGTLFENNQVTNNLITQYLQENVGAIDFIIQIYGSFQPGVPGTTLGYTIEEQAAAINNSPISSYNEINVHEINTVEVDLGFVDGVNTGLNGFTGIVKLKKVEISGDLDGTQNSNQGAPGESLQYLRIGTEDINYNPVDSGSSQINRDPSDPSFINGTFVGNNTVEGSDVRDGYLYNLKTDITTLTTVWDVNDLGNHRIKNESNNSILSDNFTEYSEQIPIRDGKIKCEVKYGDDIAAGLGGGFGVHIRLTVETLPNTGVNIFSLDDSSEKTKYTLSASIDNIESNVNSDIFSLTPNPIIETSNKIDMFVTGALSSSISSPFETGSLFSASFFNPDDTVESLYVIYPPGTTNGYNSNFEPVVVHPNSTVIPPTFTTDDTLIFNENLNITATSSNVNLGFDSSGTLTDDPTNGTASISIANPNTYGNVVTSSLITLEIIDQETGSGLLQISKSISVIPASPADMTGDFGDFSILGHPSGKQNGFYTGSLVSESLINYSGSQGGPLNPGFNGNGRFFTSSRVIFTSQSDGSHDYRITLNTHVNPVYNGNYATPNRAYSYGDTGSLEVKLNGETQFIAYLDENFVKEDNDQDQNINGYNDDFSNGVINFSGGNGKLTLNKVSPFNGVSQSITSSEGIILSNGYQGWDATIEITSKPRDGYNYIELIHNITSSLTQSLNQFDWYYDDGHYTSSLESTGNFITMSNAPSNPEPTHSISGISYFKVNYPISASINLIYHLASKTYPSDFSVGFKDIVISQRISSSFNLTGDGEADSGGTLQHRSTDVQNVTNAGLRRGLRYRTSSNIEEGQDNWIPTSKSTGSVLYHIESTNDPTGTDRDGGVIHGIKIISRQKDPSSVDTYQNKTLGQKLIGRFMTSGSDIDNYVAKTDSKETFFDEDRRWARATMEVNSDVQTNYSGDSNGYTYWLTASNANYNSNQDISITNDLQQTYRGVLKYPSKNYSVDGGGNSIYNNLHELLPNYDLLTNNSNRFYYTALRLTDASVNSNTLNFKVRVYGNFSEADIFRSLFVGDALIDDSPIRVDIKLPGPFNSQGSGWSNIGYQNDNENTLTEGWNSYDSTSDNQLGGSAGSSFIEFRLNLRNRYIFLVNGVLLFRIRYKNTTLGADTLITNLEILPD